MSIVAGKSPNNGEESAWERLWPRFLLVALAFLLACNEIADYDFWWHLRTGQLIAERGVPRTDWYSFTEPERAWIDVHWGFQILVARVYAWLGIPGIILLKGVLASATMAVATLAYRRAWSTGVQFWLLLPALVVMSSRFYERPEMFTLLFTAIYLGVLVHWERRPSLLWLLPIVQVLWANVQGLFIFGPVLLAMYWVQVFLRWGRTSHKTQLGIVSVLVGLACMASPYGVWNVTFLTELWEKMDPEAGQFYRSYIGELRDVPSFLAEGGWRAGFVWVLFGLLGLGAIGVLLRTREILIGREVFRVLPVVAFSWLGLQAIRNGSHFGLVVGLLTAWNFGPSFPARGRRIRWQPIVATVVCVGLATYFVGGRWSGVMGAHRRFGFGLHPEQFSFEAMDVCAKPGMPDKAVVFHLGHAATYIHRCGPERKVYMDPRLEVHSQPMLRRYQELNAKFNTGGDWQSVLDSYDVNVVVASSEHSPGVQAALLCSRAWKCVYWDEIAGVFLRSTWPLPDGVTEYDFRKGLWSGDPLPDSWHLNPSAERSRWAPVAARPSRSARIAERLLHLGQAIAGQPNPRDDLIRVLLWRAVHASIPGIDGANVPELWRVYGLGLVALADVETVKSSTATPFDPFVENLRAAGAATLRTIHENLPNEASVAFCLQDLLAREGAVDESILVLERMSRLAPANAAQTQVLSSLPELIRQRRRDLESKRKSVPDAIRNWSDFVAYREAGRLGELFEHVTRSPKLLESLDASQRADFARWAFSVGRRPVDSADLVSRATSYSSGEHANGSSTDALKAQIVRTILEGHSDMAWPMWGDLKDSVDGELLKATKCVIRGDQKGLEEALEKADSLGPDPRPQRHLGHLRELLVKEPDDG